MTDTDEQHDRLIRLLSPQFSIPRSASEPTGPAADELRQLIMGVPTVSPVTELTKQDVQPTKAAGGRHKTWSLRRRLAFAGPALAGLGALAFVVSAVLPESSPVGPTPAQANTLQISQEGAHLDVKILDSVADPQRYKAELARHGLNIDLKLAPATADRVGRIIFLEESSPGITTIEAPGDCTAGGNCSVGVRVPLDYKGQAVIVFGRTPKTGETVEGDAPVLTEGQEAELKALEGKRVSDARRALTARGQTATYRVGFESREAAADQVPDSWYVYDTEPLANNVVVLWVSADGKEPAAGS
ncbi:hypothetical protein E1193_06825 [Micromonospora sp. KC606]|uniref:hypothetical protein n=1 Tax=Micromonospora sp. KC606 TaxID=2530379 RepID=UPI001052998F|nr:hypothetical protein [Micromonospora sp. KC606]TDC84109.1 hypothetical protein E1193_06825 [Micromonospora sp. KC606]